MPDTYYSMGCLLFINLLSVCYRPSKRLLVRDAKTGLPLVTDNYSRHRRESIIEPPLDNLYTEQDSSFRDEKDVTKAEHSGFCNGD